MPPSEMPRSSIPSKVPPRSSSGAPYIVASLALAIVIASMLWYKLSRPPEPPRLPVVQSVSATAAIAPLDYDLPPPPVIDASSDADTDAGRKVASSGGSLCGGPCAGTNTPALEAALRAAGSSSRGCYERALRTNSMLQGRLKLTVRVGANGTVCSASVAEDSLHSSEVSSCVLGLFGGRPFPPPSGGSCVDATIPVSFTPQEGKK